MVVARPSMRGDGALYVLRTAKVVGKPVVLTFGCPDCKDEGGFYLTFSDGKATSTFSYVLGLPPPQLAKVNDVAA